MEKNMEEDKELNRFQALEANINEILKIGLDACTKGAKDENKEQYQFGIDQLVNATELVLEDGVPGLITKRTLAISAVIIHLTKHSNRAKYINEFLRWYPEDSDGLFCKAKDFLDFGDYFAAYRTVSVAYFCHQKYTNLALSDDKIKFEPRISQDEILELRLAIEHVLKTNRSDEPASIKHLSISQYLKELTPFKRQKHKTFDELHAKHEEKVESETEPTPELENVLPLQEEIEAVQEIEKEIIEILENKLPGE